MGVLGPGESSVEGPEPNVPEPNVPLVAMGTSPTRIPELVDEIEDDIGWLVG